MWARSRPNNRKKHSIAQKNRYKPPKIAQRSQGGGGAKEGSHLDPNEKQITKMVKGSMQGKQSQGGEQYRFRTYT